MSAGRGAAGTARLRGITVLVTRPRGEEGELTRRIEAEGGSAIHQPGLELGPAPDREPTLARLRGLSADDCLIFTSPAAVRHARPRLAGAVLPPGTSLWGVGERTAADLRAAGFDPVRSPATGAGSDALLAEPAFASVAGRRILILGARGGRRQLNRTLSARGARVEPVYVYRRRRPRLVRAALALMREHLEHVIVTATSAEILANVTGLFHDRLPAPLTDRPLAVVSERVADAATALGYRRIAVSDDPSAAALVEAVVRLAA